MTLNRRLFLSAVAASLLPPSIARALDIPADRRTGSVMDVEHVVILTQENRAFDHYFGTLRGVRGFGDRFAVPSPSGTVFVQPDERDATRKLAPFRLDTTKSFNEMRVAGTPHTFPDAQAAWDNGRMANWPAAKHNRAMGYFTREDIPFQFALAEAFTLCDAYHAALHAGTNPNRVFLWTGTNDPSGAGHGPVIDNGYDHLSADPAGHGGYSFVTYPERLSAAGVSWQIYQDMKDNFTDNPLAGFRAYRDADKANSDLAQRSVRTRGLDKLKEDVQTGSLPQVSWIIATAEGSEHPIPSSPAQGADYTARVLDALTSNPKVWARTVLLVNFDENDGFFDHVPPPAPPTDASAGQVDTTNEYRLEKDPYHGRPYGLGPRVPMYVVSPWSKGGFVNSQVFDHTSVLRFLETRFGVKEPNISAWRRAVSGDLMSCFDFSRAEPEAVTLLQTADTARRARKILLPAMPKTPETLTAPVQETGIRPARALPYDIAVDVIGGRLDMRNQSPDTAVVLHVYCPARLSDAPLRYTLKAGGSESLPVDGDLFLLGPNGFHRRIIAPRTLPLDAAFDGRTLHLTAHDAVALRLADEAYGGTAQTLVLKPGETMKIAPDLSASYNWYDFSVTGDGFALRFAGHVEDGQPSFSDPAFGGAAPLKIWNPL
ncbi:phosphocholine-specific phospholipase C [Asticcacaulis solisilvae]|uniref:phosphocholine-specific phospholipase C n=1 Tax=Asticcacaulis solisilvae TaxID=1217274 RepID=UPI003FD8AFD4